MSARSALVTLVATTALASSALAAVPASAMAAREFTEPARVPGTAGLANPFGSTAPDGTDVVTWGLGVGGADNEVYAKVRLPGEQRWRMVTNTLRGPFLGINGFVPTPGGDFWVTFSQGSGSGDKLFVTKLDSSAHRWLKPQRIGRDADYGTNTAKMGLTADGTLVVAFSAVPKDLSDRYRVAVATHPVGGTWQQHYLTPKNAFAFQHSLAVNLAGDIVVSWIQGNDPSTFKVRAATKAHTKGARWKVGTLSDPGDSQRARASIGANGAAAVVWSTPSSGSDAIHLATRNTQHKHAPWVGRDVVTGTAVAVDAYVTSYRNGAATVVWEEIAGGGSTELWGRTLVGGTLSSPVQLSPDGERAQFNSLVQLPNGRAGLLTQRFTTAIQGLGAQFRLLKLGQPGPASVIVGAEDVDGSTNSLAVGFNAASQANAVWTRGDFPDTDFAWASQSGKPVVMRSPFSGQAVRKAMVAGAATVGKTVRCTSGYWVEAAHLRYRWLRNGNPLSQTNHVAYTLRRGDGGQRISCQITATNPTGLLLLKSPNRPVA